MSVLIDNQIFHLQKFGGISSYHQSIYDQMPDWVKMLEKPKEISKIGAIKSNFERDFFLQKKYEVIHETYFFPAFFTTNKTSRIVTVHDLIHEDLYKQTYRVTKTLKRNQLNRADVIICVSDFTKERVLCNYPFVKTKRIEVIPHGINYGFWSGKDKANESGEYRKLGIDHYFVFVGHRHGYKNFQYVLDAFNSLPSLKKPNLVCVGGAHPSVKEMINIKKHIHPANFIHLANISQIELRAIYRGSMGFINPSKYEGFGLTNLEALSAGCRCLVSDIPVFREILNGTVEYLDLSKPCDLAEKLTKSNQASVSTPSIRDWQDAAKQYVDLYKDYVK